MIRSVPSHTLTARGSLALIFTVLVWGSAFAAIRAALPVYGPDNLGFLRFLVASVAMGVISVGRRPRPPRARDWPALLALGAIGIAGYNFFLNRGSRTVPAGVASLLINTAPIWTALAASAVLRERPRWNVWAGLSIAFLGAAVIALRQGTSTRFDDGALLVMGASLCHCVYIILQKKLIPVYGAFGAASYAVWIGTAFLALTSSHPIRALTQASLSATLTIVYLGVFPAALAYVGWGLVLKELPAARAAGFLFLVPVSAFLVAWIWLGETMSWRIALGGALVLLGVTLVNFRSSGRIMLQSGPP